MFHGSGVAFVSVLLSPKESAPVTTTQLKPKIGIPTGAALLQDPSLNKGTAFTEAEREALRLQGLLPPHVNTMEEQVARVLENYRRNETDLERYLHLASLQDRNETLFYRVLMDNLEEMMPIVYTPTVEQACQKWGRLFRRSRGLYVTIRDQGRIARLLANWPQKDVRLIVVTDGERFPARGDLGAGGMGVSIGKLALYTACAGIPPGQCLPVTLDVGTENPDFLEDPLYIGTRQRRIRGKEYENLIAEFVDAVLEIWPRALVQFEDFGHATAFRLLDVWRHRICTFNDDIQGTGAVVLAGLFSALRITARPLHEQKLLVVGAGDAVTGIGDLMVAALTSGGDRLAEARARVWFMDSKGLVVKNRTDLEDHERRYAHDVSAPPDLLSAVQQLRPTAIIGVSNVAGSFDRRVIEEMARVNQRPIVLAFSTPATRAECSAMEAYAWSHGRVVYASRSHQTPCVHEGKPYVPAQGNNAYIFPGVGLGAVACQARRITDRMFVDAARALAAQVSQSDLGMGRIYPPLERIREVTAEVAAATAGAVFEEGLAGIKRPDDLRRLVREATWTPCYRSYLE
jgi:malate dehydrogenase (oxaloacetate-decarboxylating)(NADP+)